MCPELILWDWNGTLLDDVDLCVDALNRLLAGFGYPQRYDHERYRAIFGFPIEEYYVRAGFDFTKHSFAELAEKYMEDYVPASAVLPVMQSRGMYLVAQGSAPTASQGIALLTYTLSGDALQAKQNYAIAEYYVRRIHPTQS